jgi:4-hydroxybenzoate polyprenyltransferase
VATGSIKKLLMKSIIRLIRLPNLLIIALTLYCTRYFLIRPLVELGGAVLKLNPIDFLLLNLSVIFIAAAGYIINDYFDTKIDFINRPDRLVIGPKISRKKAILWHIILSALGIVLGFYLAFRVGVPKLGVIHLLSVGLLWFYSTDFKRMFLIGNLVVAVLSGIIPLLAALFEPNRLFISFKFIMAYSLFAFITTLVRELVKDMEDIKGDGSMGCKTVPIVLGFPTTKSIVFILSFMVMVFIGYIQYLQFISKDLISFYYFLLLIQLPFLLFVFFVFKAKEQQQFHSASTTIKIIMLTGVLSMFVFYYSLLA